MKITKITKLMLVTALLFSGGVTLHGADWEMVDPKEKIAKEQNLAQVESEKELKQNLLKFYRAAIDGNEEVITSLLESPMKAYVNFSYQKSELSAPKNEVPFDRTRWSATPLMLVIMAKSDNSGEPKLGMNSVDFWEYKDYFQGGENRKRIVKLLLAAEADPSGGSYSGVHPYTGLPVTINGAIELTDFIINELSQRKNAISSKHALSQSEKKMQENLTEQIKYYTDIKNLLNPTFGSMAGKCVAGAVGCGLEVGGCAVEAVSCGAGYVADCVRGVAKCVLPRK